MHKVVSEMGLSYLHTEDGSDEGSSQASQPLSGPASHLAHSASESDLGAGLATTSGGYTVVQGPGATGACAGCRAVRLRVPHSVCAFTLWAISSM